MRFLLDNSISPALGEGLRRQGHDAVHVAEYQLAKASDEKIIDRARAEDRIAITYDLDFPKILALRRAPKPSLVIFRKVRHPTSQLAALLGNLDRLEVSLNEGCIVVLEPDRIRVRDLPLGRGKAEADA